MVIEKSMENKLMIPHRKDKQKKPEKKKPKKNKSGYIDYGVTKDEFHRVLKKSIQPIKKSKYGS